MKSMLAILTPHVQLSEGCNLRAYPDPASELYKALARARIIRAYKQGKAEIPERYRHLSGKPWTIGWGETLDVVEGMVWTQEYADERLQIRLMQFTLAVLKRCPQLHLEPDTRVAACVSLAYNIGVGAFAASSVCRYTMRCAYDAAAKAFKLWNKAGGLVMNGLTLRRESEAHLYLS